MKDVHELVVVNSSPSLCRWCCTPSTQPFSGHSKRVARCGMTEGKGQLRGGPSECPSRPTPDGSLLTGACGLDACGARL